MILTVHGINPEPWSAPEVSIGRKGGKMFPMVYKSDTLRAYQEAIKDHFSEEKRIFGDDEPFRMTFWFWRNLPDYEIADGKKSRRHVADATNLQKSLEDALQGIFYKNDRWCLDIRSRIVKQDEDTVPGIVIEIDPIFGNPIPTKGIADARLKIIEDSEIRREVDPRAELDVDDLF